MAKKRDHGANISATVGYEGCLRALRAPSTVLVCLSPICVNDLSLVFSEADVARETTLECMESLSLLVINSVYPYPYPYPVGLKIARD